MSATPEPETTTGEPEIGYEQARAELIDVVARLESGDADLAEAMKLWDRGMALVDICQRWLDGAKARVEAAQPPQA